MKISSLDIKSSIHTGILVSALTASVTYSISHDYIFRPPSSRTRQGSKLIQKDKFDRSVQENGVSIVKNPPRLQANELSLLLKPL